MEKKVIYERARPQRGDGPSRITRFALHPGYASWPDLARVASIYGDASDKLPIDDGHRPYGASGSRMDRRRTQSIP
jgi:hypothetical protein